MADDRLERARAWLKENCSKIDTKGLGEGQVVELVHATLFLKELALMGRAYEVVRVGGDGDPVDVFAESPDGRPIHLQMTQAEEMDGDIRSSRGRLGPQDAKLWKEVQLGPAKAHLGPARTNGDFDEAIREALARKENHQCPSPSILVVVQTSPMPWDWTTFPPNLEGVTIPNGFDEVWLVGASDQPNRSKILRLK